MYIKCTGMDVEALATLSEQVEDQKSAIDS